VKQLTLLVTGIFVVLLCGCKSAEDKAASSPAEDKPTGDFIRLTLEQARAKGVTAAPADAPTQAAFIVVNGTVAPQEGRQASVFAALPGRLIAGEKGMPVVGQLLEEGEVFGVVEQPPDADAALEAGARRTALENEMARARAELDLSNRELERVRKLFTDGLIPKKQVQQADLDRQRAQDRLEEVQKSKEDIEKLANVDSGPLRLDLRAPIRGVVLGVYAAPGEQVDESKAILDIIDLEVVSVETQVSEEYMPLVYQAPHVEIIAANESRTSYSGQFVSANPRTDLPARRQTVFYSVPNRENTLSIGSQVEVHLPTSKDSTSQPICQIPAGAVVRSGETAIVFVETQPQLYQKRTVEVAPVQNGIFPVLKGLSQGELVVISGVDALLDLASSAGTHPR
jgi:RND family efflux transporter MFP subunit